MNKFVFVFLFSVPVLGAVKNDIQSKIFHELKKPHHMALSGVRSLKSDSAYGELRKVAFDRKQEMPARWKALMIMSEVGGNKAIVDIKKALVGSEWYMRSAGLTALDLRDQVGAQKWAFKILSDDPALMVRMKAFEILRKSQSRKVTELFWKKLFSQDSFHNKRSLWIRNDLALHLSKEPRKVDLKRWIRLLHEGEGQFEALAGRALSKISGDKNVPATNITHWKKVYPKSKIL